MKFSTKIKQGLEIILVFLMSMLVVDVLWQVFSRYLLTSPVHLPMNWLDSC